MRLFTRNGHDWSSRYPWIIESALGNRHKQFVIDSEAVILGADGIPDFNALRSLHSRRHDEEVRLYCFDVLALDGEDLRGLPLSSRRTHLAQPLARRPDGIFVAPFEQGEIGPDLFRAAVTWGLWADRPYRAGAAAIGTIQEPQAPGYRRVQDQFYQRCLRRYGRAGGSDATLCPERVDRVGDENANAEYNQAGNCCLK